MRAEQPAFCKAGSANPYARNFPLDNPAKGLAASDPATGRFELIGLCFSGQHGIFANDADQTIYFSSGFGIGWFNTRIWDETHDDEKAQGWCPAVIDTNGDGRIGASTRADEPFDPTRDRLVSGPQGYGVGFNMADGTAGASEEQSVCPPAAPPLEHDRYAAWPRALPAE